MTFSEQRLVGRLLRPHVGCRCTSSDVSNKAGGRLDYARRSYGHKQSALIQCTINPIQFERYFAKPTDVRANPPAASAPGNFGWRLVNVRVVKRRAVASVATAHEKLSVHVDDLSRTGLLVKVVHVLIADKKALLQGVFKFREGEVGRISVWLRKQPADAWSRTPTPTGDRAAKPRAKRPPRSGNSARNRSRRGKLECRFRRLLPPR